MTNSTEVTKKVDKDSIENWFGNFIHSLNVDKDSLVNGYASIDTKALYHTIIYEDPLNIIKKTREQTSELLIKKLIYEFLTELGDDRKKPISLSFDYSDSQVLIWAIIKEDDEKAEEALIIAEAKANAKNSEFGFHISSTIVEETDCVKVPPHYKEIKLQ